MSISKLPSREATGTAEWRHGRYCARISMPDGTRPRVPLLTKDGRPLSDRTKDHELAKKMALSVSDSIRGTAVQEIQTEAAAYANRQLTTVRQFGWRWTSGELFKTHGEVKGLKIKTSAHDDHLILNRYLYPYIGDSLVAKVTEEDIERAFAAAFETSEAERGKPPSQETKRKVYQATHRLFDLAIKPGRLRTDNPVSEDLRPSKGKPRLYSFLYPTELLTLVRCEKIPLVRRVYYALASYTGLRKGSLRPDIENTENEETYQFTWGSLDFENSTITSLISKTDLPQIFAQADNQLPGLESMMVILERYYVHCGSPARDQPIIGDLECPKRREALTLRDDLRTAGITRSILFREDSKVVALRFHDLRATFVTWARRAGKGFSWIGDRTGHLTPEMVKRYTRSARMLQDLKYEPFPDLTNAIPELSDAAMKNVVRLQR